MGAFSHGGVPPSDDSALKPTPTGRLCADSVARSDTRAQAPGWAHNVPLWAEHIE